MQQILAAFNLGKPTGMSKLPRMVNQLVAKIDTDTGTYALKQWEDNRFYHSRWPNLARFLETEADFLDYLQEKSFPSHHALRTVEGRHVFEFDGRLFMVFNYVEGDHAKVCKNCVSSTGYYLGKFHALAAQYDRVVERESLSKRVREMLQEVEEHVHAVGADTLDCIRKEINSLSLPEDATLYQTICHGHPCREHVLFDGKKLSGFIDFDTIRSDTALGDIGMAVHDFCFGKNKLEPELLQTFIGNYKMGRGSLQEGEAEHLYDTIKLGMLTHILWKIGDSIMFFGQRPMAEKVGLGSLESFSGQYSTKTIRNLVGG
jgi:Ser/Thr protein kinase RdoA (MazF antagonist)